MERNFKGIWIPKEIWLSEELTIQEKVMLVEIDSFDSEERGCYASNKYFSKFFNITPGRISQIISSLVSKGYISVLYIKDNQEIKERQIHINRPPYPEVVNKLNTYLENYKGGSKYSKGGYLENYKENNITINNISNNNKETINNKLLIAKKVFKKPTIEEIKQYCEERKNNIDAEAFYYFYEANGWVQGESKKPIKNWKACIITWEKRTKDTRVKKESKTERYLREREELLREEINNGKSRCN